jgi:hypothetical protein
MSRAWLIDPRTGVELPAMPGEVTPKMRSTAAHWRIERDDSGAPVRMWFDFCDDPICCPPFPVVNDGAGTDQE